MSTGRSRPAGEWPPSPAADAAGLFRLERERLLELLWSLKPDEWKLPTPCPDWDVLGLSGHLLGDDLAWLARHRDSHHGTPAPPLVGGDGFAAWLDALQREWVQATRRLSSRLVTDLLDWTAPQIIGVMARQDAAAITASVSWAGDGPVPVWLDQVRELSERWIHRQQLLQALGRPSDLRADVAGSVLDGLGWAYPYQLSAVSAPVGQTVSVRVTGPIRRTWHLVAAPDTWHFASTPGSSDAASMTLTTEQAWRLLTNNLPAAEHDRIVATGDPALLGVLRRTRAIIGIPN